MTREILRAEVINWWSCERGRIAQELEERLDGLLKKTGEAIKDMPMSAFARKKTYHAEKIEPLAVAWIEAEYRRFSSQIDSSFSASVALSGAEELHNFSRGEYAAVGAAAAFSVAPLAALPFVGGMIASSGFLFPAATLAAVPTAVVGAGLVALGYGPSMRSWAAGKLRGTYTSKIETGLRLRVLGDAERSDVPSLKGTLFAELDSLLAKRLEELD